MLLLRIRQGPQVPDRDGEAVDIMTYRSVDPMILLLDLHDDAAAIARYEDWHRQVPAAIEASIAAAGIERMTIHRAGNRLVMTLRTAPHYDPAAKATADAADPAVLQWEAQMDTVQRRLPFARPGEKWVMATPVYTFDATGAAACD